MTRRFLVLALFALLSFHQTVQAQIIPRVIVKGRVLDDSTRTPIPLANVFISNSTIGTATYAEGMFELKGVPLGSQQVVASIVGYQPGVAALRLIDSTARTVEIRLKSRPIQMAAVEVEAKDPAEWRKRLESFLKEFIGTSENAAKCKVLNPEVLDFFEESPPLVATAREPLEIENKALGYHVRCVLVHFAFSRETMQFIVLTSYSNLTPRDETEEEEWNARRLSTFRGSQRHFLVTLLRKNTKAEGFEVNRITKNMTRRAYARPIGFDVDPDTLMRPGEFAHQNMLSFPDLLQVIYHTNSLPQVSLIEMNRPRLVVYPNGHMEDPLGVWTYGYWSSQRFSDMLPVDYEGKKVTRTVRTFWTLFSRICSRLSLKSFEFNTIPLSIFPRNESGNATILLPSPSNTCCRPSEIRMSYFPDVDFVRNTSILESVPRFTCSVELLPAVAY